MGEARVARPRVTVYEAPEGGSSPRWCRAFAAGAGAVVRRPGDPLVPGGVAAFGSPRLWPRLQQAWAEGREWWYGDHGYFGRGTYYRVTRGALQLGAGQVRHAAADRDRFESLGVAVRPWRKSGGHVLVCPPDEVFAGLMSFSSEAWRANVLRSLGTLTSRELRVRDRSCGDQRSAAPLSDDLEGCWCLVTYCSNAAVEALAAGVPVICTAPCAARDLGSGSLMAVEDPPTPKGRRLLFERLLAPGGQPMDPGRDGGRRLLASDWRPLMFEWRGLWLPDGEQHLIDWMTQVGHKREGLPTYQYHKYERALRWCPESRRRVAVDVGAHVGLWTRVLALDFAAVECFEPVADHRACWRENIRVPHARLHECALGAEPGMVTMHTGPSSSGDTWVNPKITGGTVPRRTLDSFAFPVVDFLKIDCEGYELRVLEGARETLARCRPTVIVEQKPGHGTKYDLDDTEGVRFLQSLGAVRRDGIQGDYILSWPEER